MEGTLRLLHISMGHAHKDTYHVLRLRCKNHQIFAIGVQKYLLNCFSPVPVQKTNPVGRNTFLSVWSTLRFNMCRASAISHGKMCEQSWCTHVPSRILNTCHPYDLFQIISSLSELSTWRHHLLMHEIERLISLLLRCSLQHCELGHKQML